MGKVFAQLTPAYKDSIVTIELDVGDEKNYKLIDNYKVLTIPTTILIDKNGNVIDKFSGIRNYQEMKNKLDLLTEGDS